MLCSLLNFIKVYSIITAMYHTDGTMYVNRENNVPVALNMKYNDFHTKNVYNVTIVHDNRYSDCFYNNQNKYNYITYDKGQNPDINKEIMNQLLKLEETNRKIKERVKQSRCVTTRWSEWSGCSDTCIMYRTRRVLRSGVLCPQLTELRKCCEIQVKEDEEENDEEENSENEHHLYHLRGHIRKWMNDPEPDDDEDRKHIRHVFRRYKQLKYMKNKM